MPERHELDVLITNVALAAGAGDRRALADFIRLTQADVWRLIAHLSDPDSADDLTQETYLRVIQALPRFSARSSARTWLLSIARRVVVDKIRYDIARPRIVQNVDWRQAHDAIHHSEISSRLEAEQMLSTLDPDRREALVLTQLLGFTYQEAAQICGCRIGTIRSRVARARAQLIDEWAGQDRESDAPVVAHPRVEAPTS